MNFLAVSGSARPEFSNTALLRAVSEVAPAGLSVFDRVAELPVYSPDIEGRGGCDLAVPGGPVSFSRQVRSFRAFVGIGVPGENIVAVLDEAGASGDAVVKLHGRVI